MRVSRFIIATLPTWRYVAWLALFVAFAWSGCAASMPAERRAAETSAPRVRDEMPPVAGAFALLRTEGAPSIRTLRESLVGKVPDVALQNASESPNGGIVLPMGGEQAVMIEHRPGRFDGYEVMAEQAVGWPEAKAAYAAHQSTLAISLRAPQYDPLMRQLIVARILSGVFEVTEPVAILWGTTAHFVDPEVARELCSTASRKNIPGELLVGALFLPTEVGSWVVESTGLRALAQDEFLAEVSRDEVPPALVAIRELVQRVLAGEAMSDGSSVVISNGTRWRVTRSKSAVRADEDSWRLTRE